MEDLSLHVLDLAENAVVAGATRISIFINENEVRDILTIRVSDNGPGLAGEIRRRAFDPFFSTKGKRTGLGLPLLAQAARQSGGAAFLASAGRGTRVAARFRYGHIDRQPLTNMAETMMMLFLGHPEIDVRYRHRRNGRVFSFASRVFFRGQGGRSPHDPRTIGAARADLKSGLRRIGTT